MKHRLSIQQYLVLLVIMLTASVGDTMLSHGMHQVGTISIHHLGMLIVALKNPWVIGGIVLLIGFFASYLSALSWADLTFVLPATAFGYVVVAFLSHFWLHEQISPARWTGIVMIVCPGVDVMICGRVMIVCGVGFVANGPALTEHPAPESTLASNPLPAQLPTETFRA